MIRMFLLIATLSLCSMVAARADGSTGVVEGTMRFANASPAANIPLFLVGPSGLQYSPTNRNGHFVFFNVIPGRYEVYIDGAYTFGEDCGVAPVIDVRPGLTWHLSNRLPAVYAGHTDDRACSPQPTLLSPQLGSEGTTSDLYLVGGDLP